MPNGYHNNYHNNGHHLTSKYYVPSPPPLFARALWTQIPVIVVHFKNQNNGMLCARDTTTTTNINSRQSNILSLSPFPLLYNFLMKCLGLKIVHSTTIVYCENQMKNLSLLLSTSELEWAFV